ncbi:MAG: Uma2 family endonuclease [Chloroflexi bacterium]|nr:Uma2 family endonuclease [Chloroflexota bacterium]
MGHVISISPETQVRPKPAGKISYEEFLEWYDEGFAEWVDGEIIMGQPPTYEHQDDSDFLTALLRFYVEARKAGKIISAPFQMRLKDQQSGREPDLMFVSKENLGRIKHAYLDGAADLIVEIISPESVGRDRGEKFVEYEAAGVREYWLIDPRRKQAEFYALGTDQQYHLVLIGKEGVFHSTVLDGFYLRIEWLWQNPLPTLAEVLGEMGVL